MSQVQAFGTLRARPAFRPSHKHCTATRHAAHFQASPRIGEILVPSDGTSISARPGCVHYVRWQYTSSIAAASETDFTLSLKNLDRLIKALAENGVEAHIRRAVYDAGHDALGIYQYGQAKQISMVIALNPCRGESPKPTGTAQRINEQGAPLCPAGLPMRLHGHDPHRYWLYYNCPIKRPTRRKGQTRWVLHRQECPQAELCQPQTQMGPIVYTRTEDDPRLYPPIPRHSQEFQDLMDQRISGFS